MVSTRKFIIALVLLAMALAPALVTSSVSAERNNNHNNRGHHHGHHNQHGDDDDDDTTCTVDTVDEVTIESVTEGRFNKQNKDKQQEGNTCATVVPTTNEDPTCDQLGFYTIPETVGVDYTVNGQVVTVGNHTVPNGTTVTIVAVAQQGYAFAPNTVTTWTYTFNPPVNCNAAVATTASTTPTATPQVTAVPVGAVYAGAGGASAVSTPVTFFGLLGSLSVVAVGFVKKFAL